MSHNDVSSICGAHDNKLWSHHEFMWSVDSNGSSANDTSYIHLYATKLAEIQLHRQIHSDPCIWSASLKAQPSLLLWKYEAVKLVNRCKHVAAWPTDQQKEYFVIVTC